MEPKAISSDLIRGHIDTIILYALTNGDKYAQQISDSIDEKSNNSYQINQATLYSSLKRLESLKYVNSYWNDSATTGRRKYFKLTDLGLKTVQQNLSSWSYSRAIIDKLMDCEPQPVVKTQVVERIVEVEKIVETPTEIKKNDLNVSDLQEINFRSILDGLIKTNSKQEIEKKPIEIDNLDKKLIDFEEQKNHDVQKFNDTIAENNVQPVVISDKIDFSDLSLKAAKEGFKIRVSSKDSHVEKGTLLINKLNLLSSTFTFLLSVIALFTFKFGLSASVNFDTSLFLFSLLFLTAFPLISAIKYKMNPAKTTKNKIGFDSFFVSLIVVFNLTLITFVLNLLFSVDFSSISVLSYSLILPLIIYLLIALHYLIKGIIINSKICNTKK